MPAKRAPQDPPATNAKRSKTGTAASAKTTTTTRPRNKRWSAVSVSGNIDSGSSDFEDDSDEEADENEDDEDGDDGEAKKPKKAKCAGGRTCICNKTAAEHPEHPYTVSVSGYRKFIDLIAHTNLRSPDAFDMYIFNDFERYGVLEVLQNLVLDFIEAKDNWKEQWAVCESIPVYWISNAIMPFTMIDGSDVHAITGLLANLESVDLLKPDSDVRNLHFVMAQYLILASEMRKYNLMIRPRSKVTSMLTSWRPSDLDKLVKSIEEVFNEGDIELPAPSADPWKWAAAHKAYVKEHSEGPLSKKGKIGGENYDITAMTRAERKKHSFNKKDPLGKKELDAIKNGMIMQLG
ncbi:hypothetical protein ASPCAL07815 [Aspergillus calidoustus]|uniref:Uncharacterized protein n=1 Tax=Aspergillus calidoustus TaxID=454130 RepID=A0A0U5GPU1_ASPCI|nr:hypothetical protein ASPCAL07815 [Aspergillus calidoustus]